MMGIYFGVPFWKSGVERLVRWNRAGVTME